MTEADAALYFDSIHHARAVVGVNTSAILETFVQGRPVLTVRAPEFAGTQAGTIHFNYLLPASGGALQAADTLDEHVRQLADAVDHPDRYRVAIDGFVEAFLRPQGLDRPATPIVADAIEAALTRP